VHAVKILARLLVVHGSGYSKKFSDKNGGYTVLEYHLKRWWNIPALWPICFSILFGQDIALMDLDQPFDAPKLINIFLAGGDLRIAFPEMLPVILGMLKSGLRSSVLASDTSEQDHLKPDTLSTKPQMSLHSLNGKFPKLGDLHSKSTFLTLLSLIRYCFSRPASA
jgi:hypothetical protein